MKADFIDSFPQLLTAYLQIGMIPRRAGTPDTRGRMIVNDHFQTAVPHIYAVGDVIGFPALASTSMQQARHASCHAFVHPDHTDTGLLPYGIYAIPEISMVGRTEEELTKAEVPYGVGIAHYREIARGSSSAMRPGW